MFYTVTLSKAAADSLAKLCHEYLAQGGNVRGVNYGSVSDALHALTAAQPIAPLKGK